MRISDWSSDVCSSDLYARVLDDADGKELARFDLSEDGSANTSLIFVELYRGPQGDIKVKAIGEGWASGLSGLAGSMGVTLKIGRAPSELQSLMRISYAVFCLKKNTNNLPHYCHHNKSLREHRETPIYHIYTQSHQP